MDAKKLIDEAIESINGGFKKMGGNINNPSIIERYLVASTYKAVRFSKAIILPCDKGLTDETMPILRSLIEHSINMRWIIIKNTKKRLKKYMNDLGKKGFGNTWTNKKLSERMEEVGFKNRDYYDFCVKITYSYAHVNASSLNWYEVINHPKFSKKRWSSDAIYLVVVQMLGHIMKALNDIFKGYFSDYDNIWKQIKTDPNIRERINKLRNRFYKETNSFTP